MCSISGFCMTPDSTFDARKLATALLIAGTDRGDDAAGASWLDDAGLICTQVKAMTPKQLTNKGFRLPRGARTAICHTRFATQGSPTNPLNNHPIERTCDGGETLSLVHNGVIDNDAQLFAEFDLPRNAQVDSEIVPALLATFDNDQTLSLLTEISGSMAVAWLDERTPYTLHMARGISSPLHFAYVSTPPRKNGSVIQGLVFASTKAMLEKGLNALGYSTNSRCVKYYTAREGEYTSITDGMWSGLMLPFTPAPRQSKRNWSDGFSAFTRTFDDERLDEAQAQEGFTLGYPRASSEPFDRGLYTQQEWSDAELHMEYCSDTECVFYLDTTCPRLALVPNLFSPSVVPSEDRPCGSGAARDESLRKIAEAWVKGRAGDAE